VTVAEQAGDMLALLVPQMQHTADLVQEISAASKEQSAGTEQINRALQQLDQVTQHNAATSEAMAATADILANQADALQQAMAFFQLENAMLHTREEDRQRPEMPLRQLSSPIAKNTDK